ncbi:MAG: hypothetical protein A2X56_04465 [Nitrospirae bacterium GWC2_57_13]|nr:MAG: hypothetical protein A2X56_04465 [Nitrospirae bacterium GWC2_57_13]
MKTVTSKLCLIVFFVISMISLDGFVYAARPAPSGGTLTGKVTVAGTRTVIAGAAITATGTTGTFSTVTGSKGTYTMVLPAGTYTVTCAATGYNTATSSATIKDGIKSVLNFALTPATVTTGTLTGTVNNSVSGTAIAGATVATATGGYSAVTDTSGAYTITSIVSGTYTVTASATGYNVLTQSATITAGATTTLNLNLTPTGAAVSSLTATPDSFAEGSTASVGLNAVVTGTVSSYTWSQTTGPKVPLLTIDASSATADVSTLEVAAESDLAFRLTVTGSDGLDSFRDVVVAVQPMDMLPFLGQNVQIGGSSTATAKFTAGGVTWALFNVGSQLKATPVGMVKGPVYTVVLPGAVFDIEIMSLNGITYAIAAAGNAGVAVVNVTDPTLMSIVSVTPVNYYQTGITFTDTGGTIWYNNTIMSDTAPVVALATDGVNLYIADFAFGIHRTALANVIGVSGPVLEADGTLKIDAEACTLQFAGENPWGGPLSLKYFGGRLFAGLNALGLGIFDPATMQQVGRYNLYTDEARLEDYFGPMAVTASVGSDPATGDLYLDDFTGMPDYRQVQYEVLVIMKGTGSGLTPWADFERTGKWYYKAQDVDVAQQGSRTIAYIANSLGGLTAVDVTGFENASATNFLRAPYLGYFPAVPVNGPYDTNSLPSSILPYEGAGMLKESGVTSVRVRGDKLYLTDHFAGLVILDKAATPDTDWHGATPTYNNDTNGIPNDNVPDYEDITSYDMSPWNPLDNESLPWAFYQAPSLLATKELEGHGYTLELMDVVDLTTAGSVDVLECSGAGGFVFVDVTNIAAPVMTDRFSIVAYFPTTDEIGAAADGTPTEAIAIGHASGLDASSKYLYVSDGPHGVSAWNIVDALGYPTDTVRLVANTLQSEYPVTVGTEIIYPASHTVRNIMNPLLSRTWAMCVSNGMRGVPIADVEAGLGQAGAPLLLKLIRTDLFEHNSDFTVKALPYQDRAYDVEFRGNYAFVADGSNGITIYDTTKDPSDKTSGFFVANIGTNLGEPLLGTASGIELWTDPATAKVYAVVAAGPYGVGVVDVTDTANMRIVKVFEPIKIEDGDVGVADGQAIDVEVIGDKAYFSYDSFGVVCYSMAGLIAPLPDDADPTNIFLKNLSGTVVYDYRPVALGRFKLQLVPGYEDVDGGAVKMDYTVQNGRLNLYAAFGEAGVLKIDFTDAANPLLLERKDTAAEAVDVVISNGRLYVADGSGGLVFFK